MSSGVFLTYFTIQHSIWLTTLTYGFMFGLGISLAYAPPMAVAMQWFPKKKGLVNGFIVGGFGMGAFLFNQIQTAYLNPKNYSLDESGFFTNDEVKYYLHNKLLFQIDQNNCIDIFKQCNRKLHSREGENNGSEINLFPII